MSRRLVDGKLPQRKKTAKKGGRPNKMEIDPELMNKLRNAVLMGAPIVTAAALCDISYDTMRAWVLKGKEDPSSSYGELLRILNRAIAEWELRDLSVIDAHAHGRPAKYAMKPVLDGKGKPVFDHEGKPLMEYDRDAEGNLVLLQSEIKSDWRAAMERMARRKPRMWGRHLNVDVDAVLSFTNEEREVNPKEAMSFEQRIAEAVRELEDEV